MANRRNDGIDAQLKMLREGGPICFPQLVIFQCLGNNNIADYEDTHMAVCCFLSNIEMGLGKKDEYVYATMYYAVQAIAKQLSVKNIDVLKNKAEFYPFHETVLPLILDNAKEFIKLIKRLDIDDLVTILLKAHFMNGYNGGEFKRSHALMNECMLGLENHEDHETTYADFGSGYGDFMTLLAACGMPCKQAYAFDLDDTAIQVCSARLGVMQNNAKVIKQDIFDGDFSDKFDRIFCEPSFDVNYDKIPQAYIDSVNERFNRNLTADDSDWLFALTVAEHLTENGKALVMVRQSSLDNDNTEAGRRLLLEQKYISGVVSLPAYYSRNKEKLAIVVLRKDSKEVSLFDETDVDNRGDEIQHDNYSNDKLIQILKSL